MDILYTGHVEGFCIVSSDSDYTRLATRIRETGFFVMGIGKSNTPKSLVNACELFVYTTNLTPEIELAESDIEEGESLVEDPTPLLEKAFDLAVQDDGYAFLGTLGHCLRQLDPGFDSRTYGHRQLSMLIREYPDHFEIREDPTPSGPTLYVKMKNKKK
jgi:hypothetical protein